MRLHIAIEEAGFLRALTRDFAAMLVRSPDDDEEPTLDTFRGFRDPDGNPHSSRYPGGPSPDRATRQIQPNQCHSQERNNA